MGKEQELLEEFDLDMRELEMCSDYIAEEKGFTLRCKLGLWSVYGTETIQVINDAMAFFEKHKAAGDYQDFLGSA
ncbi:hypothetical protein [Thiomicrorhabdus indica]|uniref:hypothetical protein n=1 Tax=Thiomicrorhabdus indica TaxID=2267253 RepID=UPI00102DBE1D|nr:hypothetical protein [Thiomicrorhabdus indica]